jgi:hypothetical protein
LLTPELTDFAANHLDPEWITDERVRRIAAVHLSQMPSIPGLLAAFEEEPLLQQWITEAASEQRAIPDPERQLADVILRLRNESYGNQIARLASNLSDTTLTDDERMEALAAQQYLRRVRREPLAPLDGGGDETAYGTGGE